MKRIGENKSCFLKFLKYAKLAKDAVCLQIKTQINTAFFGTQATI